MAEIKNIGDLVIPADGYPKIKEHSSLKQAIAKLKSQYNKSQIYRSLLIISEDAEEGEKIVGLLRISDILEALKHLTRSYTNDEISRMAHSLGNYEKASRFDTERDLSQGFELEVKDIISPDRERVKIDQAPSQVLEVMMAKNVQVLPVVDENEEIIGLIRALDLLGAIGDIWHKGRDD